MKEIIKEIVLEELKYGKVDVEELTCRIYDEEINFNNADPTSHMRCWEEHQIYECIIEILNEEQ